MVYDCLIVGAGPAGSVCSFLLQKNGLQCLVLEKKTGPDEKICGGFLPNRCRCLLSSCGIEIDDFAQSAARISRYREFRDGAEKVYTYKENQYGIGTDRRSLDTFLLDQSIKTGTRVIWGAEVTDLTRKDGVTSVSVRRSKQGNADARTKTVSSCAKSSAEKLFAEQKDCSFQGRYIVWAAGANLASSLACVRKETVVRKLRGQSMGISEIIKAQESDLSTDAVCFWYTGQGDDYFWAIPIGEKTWNIGYWSQNDRKNIRRHFLEGRAVHIAPACQDITSVRPPKGALLGNQDFSDCFYEPSVLCCGDAAGANNASTGEGIAQAVCSAREVAERILG